MWFVEVSGEVEEYHSTRKEWCRPRVRSYGRESPHKPEACPGTEYRLLDVVKSHAFRDFANRSYAVGVEQQ